MSSRLAFVQMAGTTPTLRASEGSPRMPAKSAKNESDGFSAEERAAMKERAAC
jgi:hypothetical protein